MKQAALAMLAVAALSAGAACVVSERCFRTEDCEQGQTCNAKGRCELRVLDGGPVPSLDSKVEIHCTLPGMVKIEEAFCIDVYEASRPDASKESPGSDDSRATSRESVIPWQVSSNAEAERACEAAGKRLCTAPEWEMACKGPAESVYGYGDDYDPATCNGIDTFPGRMFHLSPTGDFPDCTNAYGVYDMNGNVWEHVAYGNERTIRGGAYNCGDSKTLHRCDYIPKTWSPTARGFRCCAEGVPSTVDAGPVDLGAGEGDQACLPDPEGGVEDGAEEDAPAEGGTDLDARPSLDGPYTAGCPFPQMVSVAGLYCIDIYEASRPDATATSPGADSSAATSRLGVLPWLVATNAEADSACQAAGKRLCNDIEWQLACHGPQPTVYAYGDVYDLAICNGLDTFPNGQFHLTPTGDFPGCTNGFGVFDMNGNVWEHIAGGDATTIRGGAFNCSDSKTFHRCDYIPATWTPTAQGFRCCSAVAPDRG